MKQVTLAADVREGKGSRGELRTLRDAKKLPAVVYGGKKPPLALVVAVKDLRSALQKGGEHAVLTLKHAQGEDTVILKELTHDVVTHAPLHADFLRVSLKEKIQVKVHLKVVGVAPGVKTQGGILEHILRDIEVECLPTEIPEHIDVDVSALEINQALHVKDLTAPAGVKILQDPQALVVNIVVPREEAPAAPAAGEAAAAAEPEVIAKGKKEEEGAEGEAAKKDAKAPAKDAKPAAGKEAKPAGEKK